jgi:hypothetical protein
MGGLGSWVAKLVARLLATAALCSNPDISEIYSGQHTLARQKNIQKNVYFFEIATK